MTLAADVLRRCAGGEISSAVALVRLLIAYGDLDRVARGAGEPCSGRWRGGSARRDRAHRAIFSAATRRVARSSMDMLEQERALAQPAGDADEIERCRRLFDRLVATNAEASVALYSLGEPGLLDAATLEVVELLERLGVLGPERQVLDIGCGIGRFVAGAREQGRPRSRASTSRPG